MTIQRLTRNNNAHDLDGRRYAIQHGSWGVSSIKRGCWSEKEILVREIIIYLFIIRDPIRLLVDPNGHVRREPWRDSGMIHDFVERGDLGDFHAELLRLLLCETPPRSFIQIWIQTSRGAVVIVIHVIWFRWPAEERSPPWTGFLPGWIRFSDGSGRCTDRRESGAGDDCSHCNGSWD